MNVYSFDPLGDPRWADFTGRCPHASVFHTSAWLRALQRTYGFTPVVYTTSPAGETLTNALVFAAVRSRLTGRRLVSLPFSDHCDPLVDTPQELQTLSTAVLRDMPAARFKYVEVRPRTEALGLADRFEPAQRFYLHRLDLRPDLDVLLRGFHKDSIQRKIRRAEKEGLTYEEGRSERLLRQLWHLLDLTRRRHRAPLQPLAWFRNLVESLGDRMSIHIACKDGQPVAGILTLVHGDTVVYKYGGSDRHLHPLGGMPLLFWKTIQAAKRTGARQLDFGRSDCDNTGLITFKERWGATRSPLTYWRFPGGARSTRDGGWPIALAQRGLSYLPGPMRRQVGGLLYPHIG
jgi:CelD/BcsL family acetyltransferase involved in cellulose biosynthesis